MFRKLWRFKASILAFEMTFIICFFTGIFWSRISLEVYNNDSWYYINRGIPFSWAGTSLLNKKVDFPVIKAPFLVVKDSFIDNIDHAKIINLGVFIPLFIVYFTVFYIPSFIMTKAAGENKQWNFILYPMYGVMLIGCILVYFFWFPRI